MSENIELPEGWKKVHLGDACTFEYGKSLKKENRNQKGVYPVLGSNGIVGYHNEYLVNGPGIVVGRKGAAGEVKYVNENFWPIDTTYFVKIEKKDNLKYFYYLLSSLSLNQYEKSTAIPGLNRNDAYDKLILLPPLTSQINIVTKIEELFSELDKGIENLKLAHHQLKTYRQSVLKWAFEGRLTNENVIDGRLPENWRKVYINELVEKTKNALKAGPFGSSLKKEDYIEKGFKIYGQEQVISNNPFLGNYYVGKQKFIELNSCKIKPFDVLISLVGTVGKVLILPENCAEGIINPRLIKISLDSKIYIPKFFKYYFESSFVKKFYSGETKGTTMDVLNLSIIKKIPFPLCSLNEQKYIVDKIDTYFSAVDNNIKYIDTNLKKIEVLRKSILKKALQGKLM